LKYRRRIPRRPGSHPSFGGCLEIAAQNRERSKSAKILAAKKHIGRYPAFVKPGGGEFANGFAPILPVECRLLPVHASLIPLDDPPLKRAARRRAGVHPIRPTC
jgi:hypothetical protein